MFVQLGGTPVRFAGFGHTELDPERYLFSNRRWLTDVFDKTALAALVSLYKAERGYTDEESVIAALDAKTIDKTGIRSRFVFHDGTVEELAAMAVERALSHAQMSINDVDCVVVGRNTGTQYPSTADHVKRLLGIPRRAMAFDVQEACTGGLVALQTACEKVATGAYRCVVAVGVDRATQLTPNNVLESSNLFGDGAAAVVVMSHFDGHVTQLLASDFESDPHDGKAEWIVRKVPEGFSQRGTNVHKEVGRGIPQRLADILNTADIMPEIINACFTHQPSLPTVELLHTKMPLYLPTFAPRVWPTIVETYANMSAASTLYVMSQAVHSGDLRHGDVAVSIGFGASMNDGFMLWRHQIW